MSSLTYLISFLLASVGLTVLIVWPERGVSAWIREQVLRPMIPGSAKNVLDCYICLGFWCGVLLSPLWWWFCREPWAWAGGLMTPAIFWILLNPFGHAGSDDRSVEKRNNIWESPHEPTATEIDSDD